MFVSGRPVITSAPQSFGFGSSFQVNVSTQKPAGAVLISLGAMTHSFDENQRAVQVAVSQVATSTSGGWTATLTSPSSAQIAPSGYYMLFVLDSRRVPSTATIVHLG
jgi:galactose oxidase